MDCRSSSCAGGSGSGELSGLGEREDWLEVEELVGMLLLVGASCLVFETCALPEWGWSKLQLLETGVRGISEACILGVILRERQETM